MIKGFDISHNNDPIHWPGISPDLQFVFIKASQGATFHDPMFQDNWHSARDKGLVHGAYHFLTATDSAQDQANNFLNRGIDWSQPNVLPPVLDVEDQVPSSLNIHITANRAAFIQLVTDWISIVAKSTGRTPIIYSYKNFFAEYLNNHSWPDNGLWLASYQPTAPGLPVGYKAWQFWQYSEHGQLNGLSTGGGFDLDYFNGTIDDLKKL
jgi:lysozyme